jgi:MOSC domain-containing protein YiiM
MAEREGVVVAVCLSETGGVPKYAQDSVQVGPFGIDGDYHAGEFRDGEPNIRQVTVVAAEATEAVARKLDVTIPPGGLGENVLVSGLGDLGDLRPGERLRFSSGVELEVTEQNSPCSNLLVYHRLAVRELMGRRGLLTIVKSPGLLTSGDRVSIAG